MFFDKKLSNSLEFYYLEPSPYPSNTDIVEAMNIPIQERHNHSENCITVKVSRRRQKVEIYLANEGSGLAFFSTDLGHIFGSNVERKRTSQTRICLRHFPHTLPHDIHGPD